MATLSSLLHLFYALIYDRDLLQHSHSSITLTETPLRHRVAVSRWAKVCLTTEGSEDATNTC